MCLEPGSGELTPHLGHHTWEESPRHMRKGKLGNGGGGAAFGSYFEFQGSFGIFMICEDFCNGEHNSERGARQAVGSGGYRRRPRPGFNKHTSLV